MQIAGNQHFPRQLQPLQTHSVTLRRTTLAQSAWAFGEDRVSISAEARQQGQIRDENTLENDGSTASSAQPASSAGQDLSLSERRVVNELRQRDREVRAHEQAHLAAAGALASGGEKYTYQVGPDGKRYAVGGEVPIDVSVVPNDPRGTIQKAATIRRAALAPANPSGADRAIAMQAALMAAKAQQELMEQASAGQATGKLQANRAHAAGEDCEACRTSQSGGGTSSGQEQSSSPSASPITSILFQQALQSYAHNPSIGALNLIV
jgi:hypothetical protein